MEHKPRSKSTWQKFKGTISFNSATLSGCLDIIICEDKSGNRKSSGFHFTVGKIKSMKPENKKIDLYLNKKILSEKMSITKDGKGIFCFIRKKFDDDFLYADFLTIHDNLLFLKSGKQMFNLARHYKLKQKKNKLAQIVISNCGKEVNKIYNKKTKYEDINNIFKKNIITKKEYSELTEEEIKKLDLIIKIHHSFYKCDKDDFIKEIIKYTPCEKKKTTSPSKEFLQKLKLKEGINSLIYVFKGNLGKTFSLKTRIFYYPFRNNYRVIVSDIDGTITKSDILGHIMPIFNVNWAHKSICEFYTNLHKRNYIIIYLTARNIGQASKTKKYLKSVKQNKYKLPDGPTITSTKDLFDAINTELIIKNPELNKIKVMSEIFKIFNGQKMVFDEGERMSNVNKFEKRFKNFDVDDDNLRETMWLRNYNPIYAGFGNKDTDTFAYKEVNIDFDKIFQIDKKSKIKIYGSKAIVSYKELNEKIDEFFPEYKLDNF